MRIRNLQGMRIKIEEEEGRGGEQEEPIDLSSGRREKTLPQVPCDQIKFHRDFFFLNFLVSLKRCAHP